MTSSIKLKVHKDILVWNKKKYDFKKQGGVKEECQSLWIYCAIHRDDTLFFEKKRKKIGNDIVLQLLELEVC